MKLLQVLSKVAYVAKFPIASLEMASVWLLLGMAHIMLEQLAQTDLDQAAVVVGALE